VTLGKTATGRQLRVIFATNCVSASDLTRHQQMLCGSSVPISLQKSVVVDGEQ